MLSPEKKKLSCLWVSIAWILPLLLITMPVGGNASQKTFRGEISIEQGYESNIDRVPENEQHEYTSRISPNFIITRQTPRSSLALSCSPGVAYDWEADEERFDYSASLSGEAQVTRRFHLSVEDIFIQSDDPYTYTQYVENDTGDFELSDRRGRRRYWTNRLSVTTNLEYARGSVLGLGYTNYILNNRDDEFDDFTRHTPFTTLTYRFNNHWEVETSYSFTKGEFEQDEDIKTHEGDVILHYTHSPFTSYFVHGGYLQTAYEDSIRDYAIHTLSVGINRDLTPLRSIDLETGGSRIVRDTDSDSEAFYMRAALDNQLRNGDWRIYGESGFDERYYDGSEDDDLSRYWLIGAGIRHGFSPNTTGSLDVSFREDRYIDRPEPQKEEFIRISTRLAHTFARYYEISAGYAYVNLKADEDTDAYENHRAFVRFSAGKDLLRW